MPSNAILCNDLKNRLRSLYDKIFVSLNSVIDRKIVAIKEQENRDKKCTLSGKQINIWINNTNKIKRSKMKINFNNVAVIESNLTR